MVPVKKPLNVVVNCEMWGRLRCAAASIGYRWEIRKGLVHSPASRGGHAGMSRAEYYAWLRPTVVGRVADFARGATLATTDDVFRRCPDGRRAQLGGRFATNRNR